MKSSVIHELARFLEALPYQVQAWDHQVIDHLVRHTETFRDFQKSDAAAKWDIYSSIKYQAPL